MQDYAGECEIAQNQNIPQLKSNVNNPEPMNSTQALSLLNITLPLTLEGSVVRLEPIREAHAEMLWEVAKADVEDIFRWIPYAVRTREDFTKLVAKALDEQRRGESVAFATVERSSGQVIGST